MRSPIHIAGAGVMGCFMMHQLWKANISFSWSDIGANIVAWKASTGSVIPDEKDPKEIFPAWNRLKINDGLTANLSAYYPYYKYSSKNGWVHKGVSLHLNVQEFVQRTRDLFCYAETSEANFNQTEIMTVGHMYCKHFWWGWSALAESKGVERACWSARVVRQSRYIYPKPGTDQFYIGSTITQQTTPKELDLDKHFKWWKREWQPISPAPDLKLASKPICGWRPVGVPGEWKLDDQENIIISPQSASGVKFGPLVTEQIVTYIQENNLA